MLFAEISLLWRLGLPGLGVGRDKHLIQNSECHYFTYVNDAVIHKSIANPLGRHVSLLFSMFSAGTVKY